MPDSGHVMLQAAIVIGQTATDGPGLQQYLRTIAEQVFCADDVSSAYPLVERADAELVVICDGVSPTEGMGLLLRMQAASLRAAVVVISDKASIDLAVRYIRAGALDYLEGPSALEGLQRAVAVAKARRRVFRRDERFFSARCPPGVPIAGHSSGIVNMLGTVRVVAESNCNPVLVLGETGTGKELVARAVHALRCGDEKESIAINCAALTASLLESELFGHVKGAFTGADRDKTGLFEAAGDGSILLDEISEMPQDLQAKLLRVVQEKSFRKVGGTKDIPCHATIIASSNRDLFAEVQAGRFRRDLYYRLAIFPITVPPLRADDRRGDIPLLAEYFIETSYIPRRTDVCGLSAPAREELLQHTWPGNVRELRNVIDRALILEQGGEIGLPSIVIEHREPSADRAAPPPSPMDYSLKAAEREFILRALQETGWRRAQAAALLGISRATLLAKLRRYDIKAPGVQAATQPPEAADSVVC